jgi:hypothetical protein
VSVERNGPRRTDPVRHWVVLVAVAALSLVAGGLLTRAFGESGSTAPLDVLRQAPIVNGGQVWGGRMQDGVPVGWARSPDGAAMAATDYTVALSQVKVLFDPTKRRLAVHAIAAPEARAGLQRDLDATAAKVAAALTRGVDGGSVDHMDLAKTLFQTVPIRYHLDVYDGTHARVSIWQVGVAGYQDSSLPVQEAWGVTTVQLRWAETDWKETGATVTDGPTPVADETPPTPTPALVSEAQRFVEYHPYPPR